MGSNKNILYYSLFSHVFTTVLWTFVRVLNGSAGVRVVLGASHLAECPTPIPGIKFVEQ